MNKKFLASDVRILNQSEIGSSLRWSITAGESHPWNLMRSFGEVTAAYICSELRLADLRSVENLDLNELDAIGSRDEIVRVTKVGGREFELSCSFCFPVLQYRENLAINAINLAINREFRVIEEWSENVVIARGVVTGSLDSVIDSYVGGILRDANAAISLSTEEGIRRVEEFGWVVSSDVRLPFFLGKNFVFNPYFDINFSASHDPKAILAYLDKFEALIDFAVVRAELLDEVEKIPIDTVVLSKPSRMSDVIRDYFPTRKVSPLRSALGDL